MNEEDLLQRNMEEQYRREIQCKTTRCSRTGEVGPKEVDHGKDASHGVIRAISEIDQEGTPQWQLNEVFDFNVRTLEEGLCLSRDNATGCYQRWLFRCSTMEDGRIIHAKRGSRALNCKLISTIQSYLT